MIQKILWKTQVMLMIFKQIFKNAMQEIKDLLYNKNHVYFFK